MNRLRSSLLALVVLAAAGCASGPDRVTDKLALASRNYHDALQFGDFQVIAHYLLPAARTDFLARAYGMEKTLSVLEFLTIGTEIHPDGEKATMVTRLSWYELPSTVVKTENVFIRWRLVGGSVASEGNWIIEAIEGGPLPVAAAEAAAEAEGPAAE